MVGDYISHCMAFFFNFLKYDRWGYAHRVGGEFGCKPFPCYRANTLDIQTRLVHIRPSELLLSKSRVTEETAKMLSHFTG